MEVDVQAKIKIVYRWQCFKTSHKHNLQETQKTVSKQTGN